MLRKSVLKFKRPCGNLKRVWDGLRWHLWRARDSLGIDRIEEAVIEFLKGEKLESGTITGLLTGSISKS